MYQPIIPEPSLLPVEPSPYVECWACRALTHIERDDLLCDEQHETVCKPCCYQMQLEGDGRTCEDCWDLHDRPTVRVAS